MENIDSNDILVFQIGFHTAQNHLKQVSELYTYFNIDSINYYFKQLKYKEIHRNLNYR